MDEYYQTPEQLAQQRRQTGLYTAQNFLKGENVTAEDVISFAKRVTEYLETGV